jgi:hypothetical protein
VTLQSPRDAWTLRASESEEFVFCNNNLSQQNIIVNPQSLKILAIIDWEYAGFYPEFFEGPFYKLLGPSVALDGEVDDTEKLLDFLRSRLVCTPILLGAALTIADSSLSIAIVDSPRNPTVLAAWGHYAGVLDMMATNLRCTICDIRRFAFNEWRI